MDNQPVRSNPAPAAEPSQTTTVRQAVRAEPRPKPAPSANAIVAQRFPAGWQATIDPTATQALAFAPEPRAIQPVRQAPEAPSGYQLASVDPEPAPMPKRVARPSQPKNPVLFNDAQLASIKARLRLSPDQEHHWPRVEEALRAISWRLATRQDGKRAVRGNQAAMIDPNSPEVARLKSAAFPLILSLRADQKEEVRQLAHTMGLGNVAAMF